MPKAFAALRYLVEHAGRLVTQDELRASRVTFRGGSVQPLTHLSAPDSYSIARSLAQPPRSGFRQRARTAAKRFNFGLQIPRFARNDSA
ncbi:MAG TPA: helix-turn-helix domain-containing protein [Terriglobales bacterium]|nr:helix-turn-helix domain-containing protein [Terriglobales bacterium]